LSTEIALAQGTPEQPSTYDSKAVTNFLENYPPRPGVTILEITVATDGRVTAAAVVHSSDSQKLDDAAIQFTKDQWRWKPPASNGAATEVKVRIEVAWRQKESFSDTDPRPERANRTRLETIGPTRMCPKRNMGGA